MEFRLLDESLGASGASGLQGGVTKRVASLAQPTTFSKRALTRTEYSVPGFRSSILFVNNNLHKIDVIIN